MLGVRGAWPCLVQNPIEAATNPFPNLSLVSMGQDVDVRLQGAGFDDHFVPGVVGGRMGWGGGHSRSAWPEWGLTTCTGPLALGQLGSGGAMALMAFCLGASKHHVSVKRAEGSTSQCLGTS